MQINRKFITCFTLLLTSLSIPNIRPAHANSVDEIVQKNAPLLISRKDQARNPDTDRPLLMTYSLQYFPQGEAQVRYTVFFTDEDSLGSKIKVENQMGRYGRRLDIEWVMDVRFNVISGQIVKREYQCDVTGGIGHKTCKFTGKFDPVTGRPVLYIITQNNVFSDKPQNPYGDPNGKPVLLEPKLQIVSPYARERVLFDHPELFQASDVEISRENRLEAPSTEYIYLRLRGVLNYGGFWLGVRDKSGTEYWSGDKKKDALLEKIGEDLWSQESFVGIQIPESLKNAVVEKRETLTLLFKPRNRSGIQFELKELGAFLINRGTGGYETVDLSPRIDCSITNRVDSCAVL